MGKIVELLAEDTATVGPDLFVPDIEGDPEDAFLHVELLLVELQSCRPLLWLALKTRRSPTRKEIWLPGIRYTHKYDTPSRQERKV